MVGAIVETALPQHQCNNYTRKIKTKFTKPNEKQSKNYKSHSNTH
jgi:hypothetical protein